MKVMYVESAYGFGGSLTGLLHLFDALPSTVQPILVTCFDPTEFTTITDNIVHEQVDVPGYAPSEGDWLRGIVGYYRHAIIPWRRSLSALVNKHKPDLLHANNSLSSNFAVGMVGRRNGIPAISHQKGFEHLGRFSRWLVRHNQFDHHVATSRAIANHLFALGVAEERCSTLYEPVIGPQLPIDASKRDDSKVTLAMHSMVVPEKGQHVFLAALAELRGRNTRPFRALIAGTSPGGETAYVDSLHRAVQERGLEDVVSFVGHQRDVYAFLSNVDVAVHAAVAPEPFGRVVAEAMLAGLPTVVTADGGPAEYVEDGVTGYVVARDDAHALANVLERLIQEPATRMRVGFAARNYAACAFEPCRLTASLVELYEELAACNKNATDAPQFVRESLAKS